MKRDEILPFLKSFVTITLNDGSESSGYISNYDEIAKGTSDDIDVKLMNGLLVDRFPMQKILMIKDASRQDTSSIPVINLKDGYQNDTIPQQTSEKEEKVTIMKYVISVDCTCCGECESACPEGAISLGEDTYVTEPTKCTGCGECVKVCPVNAIIGVGSTK